MNFEACLSLPRDACEAALIADNLEALGRALREWPVDAWQRVVSGESEPAPSTDGLFERLVARTAPAAVDERRKTTALRSAEAVADVLRVLWPDATSGANPTEDSRALALA